ncbi:NAD(P)/FAD-dependent oxidoreductase [Micropruina sonneratiae]|uniref:NAD(P)/FAD-dependent oxidoreductase n=1 Tax=Micropruina sonneratiae TaxID=2986940 RepID=UPI0022268C2B|nr:FAD-dependent oxidoreductase [Micropruina sp. KQZ13P-5]MCW3159333.1 FAD-dependent oxidoreductase [Micropruina sp. KQZ13P-5]
MTEIVVLGGGYTGVWAARTVSRAIRAGLLEGVRVTLVSATPEHSFHGWTAEVITGHVRPEHARVPLTQLLPGVRLVHGRVSAVDVGARTVSVATASGTTQVGYDQLVVGVGSFDATERVPGLAEHGWSLKDPDGLAALRTHLGTLAAGETVLVAGAGFTGLEAATAIAQRHPRLRVKLAHPGTRPLPMLRPRFDRVADYAVAQARSAGVEFLPDSRLAEVSPDGGWLDPHGPIATRTVISTIGQTPVALPGLVDQGLDGGGRLITDLFLRVAPRIWAGGDVAAVPQPGGEGACPANALWAIHHGTHIGANLVRHLLGWRLRPFRFPGLGHGAGFGVGRGAAELYGVQLTGWAAWLARWLFFHWYMPSRRIGVRTAAEWLLGPVSDGRVAAWQPSRSLQVMSSE